MPPRDATRPKEGATNFSKSVEATVWGTKDWTGESWTETSSEETREYLSMYTCERITPEIQKRTSMENEVY